MRKHLVVVITADAKGKKLIGISVRIVGPGRSKGMTRSITPEPQR